jgi:hypothetical protein
MTTPSPNASLVSRLRAWGTDIADELLPYALLSEAADAIEALQQMLAKAAGEIMDLQAECDRLRAALENIVATESVDNDGYPVPETGAAFLAREALDEGKSKEGGA